MKTVRGELRITGGTARGTKLYTVPSDDVRPALARLRISLFEILRPRLDGARAIDLFAGTGSLGFEAISRGAAGCVFFDNDPRCIEALRRNVEKLRVGPKAEIVEGSAMDAPRHLKRGDRRHDIVFVDPPYAFYDDPKLAADLEAAVADLKGLLNPDALVLVEHRTVQKRPETWAGFRRVDERVYGGTTLTFYS